MFGNLGGGALPFEESCPGSASGFAFRGPPVIVITAALWALLYLCKIIPLLVRGAWASAGRWVMVLLALVSMFGQTLSF